MLRKLGVAIPSSIAAALVLGLALPASADVGPPRAREREVRELEPQQAPPAEPPAEPEAAPEQPPAPPAVAEPPPEATPEPKPAEDKKAETKKAEEKAGNCSIDEGPERSLFGLALVVLLISGTTLGRRRA